MFKRILVFFSIIMFLICMSFIRLDDISNGEDLYNAAICQQSYKIKICDVRGNIYDCRNYPLVNCESRFAAAIIPSIQNINEVSKIVSQKDICKVCEQFRYGRPFVVDALNKCKSGDIDVFKIPVRYSRITLAPHIIGYIDGNKNGVYGIEKAYDDFLKDENSAIYVKYNVDASNRIITGNNKVIDDKSYMMSRGVVLNIDTRIQSLAEEVSNKYIEKGAVLITEVPNCEIRASVSLPSFLPQSVSDYLNDKNSPMLNRVLCKYNVGSIFKLVTAATALESGIDEEYSYECTGSIDVDDVKFHCFNGKAHDMINMEQAIAYSCNTYFVNLIKNIDINNILKISEEIGFGKSQELAPGMSSAKGYVPSVEELENEKNRANFSFGQGSLLATPLQISGLINTIASGGEYSEPKLVKELVNEDLKPIDNTISLNSRKRIIKKDTAEKLKKYMKASIDYGTSLRGRPDNVEACAKTSTAQTGIKLDNRSVIQAWYAGFFPLDKPKYCIVVLSEDATGGGESCGPVFKEIVDRMTSDLKELFLD